VSHSSCVREKNLLALCRWRRVRCEFAECSGDSALVTIVGSLRAHARCVVVPPLRGLRSLAMLAQRLRAGLVYGAALRLGWWVRGGFVFSGEKCDAIVGDAYPALTRWADLWGRLAAWVVSSRRVRRFGIGDDRWELAGSRPLRVPPLRGLRSCRGLPRA
jgi:hypothetical protein